MKGKILDFSIQSNSGAISGEDGDRYNFDGADWKGDSNPARGMSVDFSSEGNQAKEVYLAVSSTTSSGKSKIAAGLLAIFLGGLGIHKFYLGYTVPGVIFLLINTVGWVITWMVSSLPQTKSSGYPCERAGSCRPTAHQLDPPRVGNGCHN